MIRDDAAFLKQLSLLIKSGVPLIRALEIVNAQKNNDINTAEIIKQLEYGVSFSDSLNKLGRYNDFIPSFRIAERDGRLEEALLRAAGQIERKKIIYDGIKKSLTYPIIILLVSAMCVLFLVFYILPNFSRLFSDFNCPLPPITRIIMVLPNFWPLYLAIAAFFAFLIAKIVKNPDLKLRIPFAGKIFLSLMLGDAMYSIGAQIKSGVPILESIQSAIDGTKSHLIKRELTKAYDLVKHGKAISFAFNGSKIFPKYIIQMASVGEQTGELDNMLVSAGEYITHEAEKRLKNFALLVEPAATLAVGVIVGFIAMAMVMPLFSMMNSVL